MTPARLDAARGRMPGRAMRPRADREPVGVMARASRDRGPERRWRGWSLLDVFHVKHREARTSSSRELRRWQRIKNLVGPATLDEVWTRHIADCAAAPRPRAGARTGSISARARAFRAWCSRSPGADARARVDLVESNARKCAFLRHAARADRAPAPSFTTRASRRSSPSFVGKATSSRPGPSRRCHLLAWTEPLLTTGAIGLFPEGTRRRRRIDRGAQILEIRR